MSQNVSPHWLLVLNLLLIIGLPITLLILMMKKATNRGANNIDVITSSEYAAYAPWVVAQAKHESANFSSRVYVVNNNPFGMKVPSQRKFLGAVGTKAPDGGYYAAYYSDTVAFQDFLTWLRARKFPVNLPTLEQYVSEMKYKGYFGDTVQNYLAGVKRFLK